MWSLCRLPCVTQSTASETFLSLTLQPKMLALPGCKGILIKLVVHEVSAQHPVCDGLCLRKSKQSGRKWWPAHSCQNCQANLKTMLPLLRPSEHTGLTHLCTECLRRSCLNASKALSIVRCWLIAIWWRAFTTEYKADACLLLNCRTCAADPCEGGST